MIHSIFDGLANDMQAVSKTGREKNPGVFRLLKICQDGTLDPVFSLRAQKWGHVLGLANCI